MPKGLKLVDLRLLVFHETEKAFLVGETEDRDKAVWIPKGNCEIDSHIIKYINGHRLHDFTVEEWIAEEKGLI